ncbi:hypothetical protein K435DRAFT_876960 [Dendrothele bispora CBS 962.96]|uniref:Ribonuclease H1 N-terminal domain-containing protein n=1 Tax=Dendrothele bispora (strain CBS 962.96) TaxID=1314807 RepID=A0A4S8KQX8_DENBC|nr:hypothetical protein K435DRAFT_876960 [Dendrothele bispora CBS 962.96]
MNTLENTTIDSNAVDDNLNDTDADSGSEPEFVGYSPRKTAGTPCTSSSRQLTPTRRTTAATANLPSPPPYRPRLSPPTTPLLRNNAQPSTGTGSYHYTSVPSSSPYANPPSSIGGSHPAAEPLARSYHHQDITPSQVASTSTPRTQRKAFVAYVVYRSNSHTGVYYDWRSTHSVVKGDRTAVYKGFPTRSMAETSYNLTRQYGIIELLTRERDINTEPCYTVVEGAAPGVYVGRYQMLRDGLNWSHGVVSEFNNTTSANSYFVSEYMAGRVVTLARVFDVAS